MLLAVVFWQRWATDVGGGGVGVGGGGGFFGRLCVSGVSSEGRREMGVDFVLGGGGG
ncbi:hypothetical protein HanIR_Chr05g0224761 [Helianthus annuus]|nr:hypothetical protein HanIR_Chr05g0224761 [Helianthus annuus]